MSRNAKNGNPSETRDVLQSFPFFKDFSTAHIEEVAKISQIVHFDEDQVIISQGEKNDKLYFLIEGRVSIDVDGVEIADLDQLGDLIGEMSVISSQLTAASATARVGTKLLSVKSLNLAKISHADLDEFNSHIFRVYSEILVAKLSATNTKAKLFENTMADLKKVKEDLHQSNLQLEMKVEERTKDVKKSLVRLEQQNVELSATQEQLIELASIKRTALSRIEDLYQRVLPTLETKMTLLAASFGGEMLKDIVEMKLEIREVIDMIKPIAEMASTEQSIRSKRVLVAEHEKKQQIIIKMAMGGSGVDITVVANVLEARKAFDEYKFDLIIANTENIEVLFEARKRARDARLILIAPLEFQSYLGILEEHPEITNVVSRSKEDRSFTSRIILATVTKILSREIFGMEKYLAWGVEVLEWRVTGSEIRSELISKMTEVFSGLGVRRSFLDRCALVSEEMLMNAVYDAPVDSAGRAKYNHIDRKQAITLQEEEQGYYRIACDGNYLAISVSDPFGSLTKDTILMYLRSCYEGHAGVYNEKKGGAGRGLHQIVENADLVIFNVKKNMRTEVLCLIYLDKRAKSENHTNSFQFFFE